MSGSIRSEAHSASVSGVAITHGDRHVWPGIIKLALARYYEAVTDWLLPHLVRRPLTLVRAQTARAATVSINDIYLWQRARAP